MANQLIIRIHPNQPGMDPDLVSWVVAEAGGQCSEIYQGSLDEVAPQLQGNKVVVIVPGNDIFLTTASIPTKNKKRLLTALPYALEDQLVSDVEDLHFAVGDQRANGDVACAVVERKKMDEWTGRLQQFGIKPDFIIPDILSLPVDEQSWTLLAEDSEVLMRTGKQSGYSVEVENTEPWLRMLLEENSDQAPEWLNLFRIDGSTESFPDLSDLGIEIKEDMSGNGMLPLVNGMDLNNTINLLQGDYSRREQMGKVWRPWWPAAAMLAGLIVLQMVMTITDYFQLKSQSNALQAQIKQTYLSAFPDTKNIVNPRVQMQRKLKALRGGSGQDSSSALGLIASAAPVIKATPGLVVRSVRYKEGKLDVDLIIKDLQALDKLKQQLTRQAGMSVEIVSANSRNNQVESRLKLRSTES